VLGQGIDPQGLAIVAGCILLWGLVSARLERWSISPAMTFIAFGLICANEPLSLLKVQPGSEAVRAIAQVALAMVLFTDALRVNLRRLRSEVGSPVRLLTIGMPLTIALGTVGALWTLGSVNPWIAAVIATAVSPTDAALIAPIVDNRWVPSEVRDELNLESGLNDGIATPIFTFFLAEAVNDLGGSGQSPATALWGLFGGAVGGFVIGLVGARLLRLATDRGWAGRQHHALAILALALFLYGGALSVHANGFVAAFAGGAGFGAAWFAPGRDSSTSEAGGDSLILASGGGQLLSMIVWFLFGALLVSALEHASWAALGYAVLSLTVVRGLAIAVAMIGSRHDRTTRAFVAWFGPRGLATVVFALIAYGELHEGQANFVLAVVTCVVLLSVVVHGATAAVGARWFARREGGGHGPSRRAGGERGYAT
jgi:sodium/hydrogen antiporter